MSNILVAVQLFFTVIIGMYFLNRLRGDSCDDKAMNEISKDNAGRESRQ